MSFDPPQPTPEEQQQQFVTFQNWLQNFFQENEGADISDLLQSTDKSKVVAKVKAKVDSAPVHGFMSGDALPEDPNPDDLEKFLARDMEDMKVEERELLFETIHGVDPIVKETPELIVQKLEEMELEIEKQKATSEPGCDGGCAYDQAKAAAIDYVKGLYLMFLRADRFVASKAAKRILGFFEAKLEMFGPDALARPLFLSDLNKHDLAYMRAGHFQLLSIRDRSGRAICCDFEDASQRNYKSFENLVSNENATVCLFVFGSSLDEC